MNINNFLFLELTTSDLLTSTPKNALKTDTMSIGYIEGSLLPSVIRQTDSMLLIVIGAPSYTQIIDNNAFIERYLELKSTNTSLSSIDGEFLIIDFNFFI